MKKTLGFICAAAVALSGFVSVAEAANVGVAMPTKSLQRWNQDGANLKKLLEEQGHKVDLQYAGDNDIPTQVNQIENMIASGNDVIVIASIDGSALTEVLKGAKEHNIPVIAYDRLIMNSDAVSYYATFDNYKVGVIQGQYIVDALDLPNAKEPKTIELFAGPTDDNNAIFFWNGAMSALKPYMDSGKLVVKSGQTSREQAAILNWNPEESQKRMENIIASVGYGPDDVKLDAVLAQADSVSVGVTNALLGAGYDASNMPIITGQDCDRPSVKNMIRGYQAMSIFKDTRTLALSVRDMVNAIIDKTEVPVNDTKTYNNGTGIIPSFLCEPVIATRDNYKALLIDSGYYKASEL